MLSVKQGSCEYQFLKSLDRILTAVTDVAGATENIWIYTLQAQIQWMPTKEQSTVQTILFRNLQVQINVSTITKVSSALLCTANPG